MLQTASLTGFLETILIILLVYYGIKFFSRLFGPYMLRYLSKKMQDQFGGQSQQRQNQSETKRKEGETVIDKMPQKNTSSNKDVGEYIDYEEID